MGVLIIPQATTAERTGITPALGELIYDEDLNLIFRGDGSTVGGVALADAGAGVLTVTGTAVGGTSANPTINIPTPKQYVITPAAGNLDYDLGLEAADFQNRQAFRVVIDADTALQLPTFNSAALPTDFATSYIIEIEFDGDRDLSFVAGYQNGDTAAATIEGLNDEVYRLYCVVSQNSGIIDVNPIQIA